MPPAKTLLETAVPLWPVTIHRRPKLFYRSLGLTVGTPGTPSADFLVALYTGRATVKSFLREVLGAEYKNVENLAKGRRTSPTVRARLLGACEQVGLDRDAAESLLEVVGASIRGEPQGTTFQQIGLFAETFVCRLGQASALALRGATAHTLEPPAVAAWWALHGVQLGAPEAAFVDRLLFAVVGRAALAVLRLRKPTGSSMLQELMSAGQGRPFANWLEVVRRKVGAPALKDVPARMGSTVPAEKLFRVKQGDMLTQRVAQDLLKGYKTTAPWLVEELDALALDARILAFAVDFLCAASARDDALEDDAAWSLVSHRLGWLTGDLLVNAAWGLTRPPGLPPRLQAVDC